MSSSATSLGNFTFGKHTRSARLKAKVFGCPGLVRKSNYDEWISQSNIQIMCATCRLFSQQYVNQPIFAVFSHTYEFFALFLEIARSR